MSALPALLSGLYCHPVEWQKTVSLRAAVYIISMTAGVVGYLEGICKVGKIFLIRSSPWRYFMRSDCHIVGHWFKPASWESVKRSMAYCEAPLGMLMSKFCIQPSIG